MIGVIVIVLVKNIWNVDDFLIVKLVIEIEIEGLKEF